MDKRECPQIESGVVQHWCYEKLLQKVVGHWLFMVVVESLSLEGFKKCGNVVLRDLV